MLSGLDGICAAYKLRIGDGNGAYLDTCHIAGIGHPSPYSTPSGASASLDASLLYCAPRVECLLVWDDAIAAWGCMEVLTARGSLHIGFL